MFELAKTIFSKHIESVEESSSIRSELETKLSETYQYLGEVSIENEDYKQAVEDLTTCLTRRQKNLPEDSRSIAETHYQVRILNHSSFVFALDALSPHYINYIWNLSQLGLPSNFLTLKWMYRTRLNLPLSCVTILVNIFIVST